MASLSSLLPYRHIGIVLLSGFLPFSRYRPPSSYMGLIHKPGKCEEEEGEGNGN